MSRRKVSEKNDSRLHFKVGDEVILISDAERKQIDGQTYANVDKRFFGKSGVIKAINHEALDLGTSHIYKVRWFSSYEVQIGSERIAIDFRFIKAPNTIQKSLDNILENLKVLKSIRVSKRAKTPVKKSVTRPASKKTVSKKAVKSAAKKTVVKKTAKKVVRGRK
jgi:hypothetical protein